MTSSTRQVGIAALVVYITSIWAANFFITHVGDQPFPGGPHVIPVGFGLEAPSGVLWVGVALLVRDVVQRSLGWHAVLGAIAVGAGLSYFIAPSFAWASAAAFLTSELLDFAAFTPLNRRGRVVTAVVASNAIGAVVDTFIFLWIAFGSVRFWQGQVVGKMWATLLVLPLLWWWRRRDICWACDGATDEEWHTCANAQRLNGRAA